LRAGHPPPRPVPGGGVPDDGQRHHRRRVPHHHGRAVHRGARDLPGRAAGGAGAPDPHRPDPRRVRRQRPGRPAGAARLMTTTLLIAPVGVPVLAACGYAVLGWRRATAWLAPAAAAAVLAAAVWLAVLAVEGPRTGLGGLLRADALTAFMLIVIGAVSLAALPSRPAHLAAEREPGSGAAADLRRYGVLTQGFIASMALAVLASSLGVLWVARSEERRVGTEYRLCCALGHEYIPCRSAC